MLPAKTGLGQPENAQVDGLAAEGSAPPPCGVGGLAGIPELGFPPP